jgi:hypothetical protein
MSDQEINIAIAEACGWKREFDGNHEEPEWYWIPPNNPDGDGEPPDYCNDLNAMHEAEKVLTHDQQVQFSVELGKLTTSHLPSSRAAWMDFTIAHATAAQRREAFLRTLGKWEEAK